MSEQVPGKQSRGYALAEAVQKLVDVTAISWGFEGNWRGEHVVAVKNFSLPSIKDSYTIPKGETVLVHKNTLGCETYQLSDSKTIPAANVKLQQAGDRLSESWLPPKYRVSCYIGDVIADYKYVAPSIIIEEKRTAYLISGQSHGSSYRVRDKSVGFGFEGPVEATFVKRCQVGETVPNHEIEPIELMCFELLPYAAMRADLITKEVFFTGLGSARKESGSGEWAEFLGELLTSKPDLTLDDLKTARFNPGDIIVLYDGGGASIHTVIGSGLTEKNDGQPLVYSLSHSPKKHPGLWSIMQVANTLDGMKPVVRAKVFTPKP